MSGIPAKQTSFTSNSPEEVSIPKAAMITPVTSKSPQPLSEASSSIDLRKASPTSCNLPDSSSSMIASSGDRYFSRGGGAGKYLW